MNEKRIFDGDIDSNIVDVNKLKINDVVKIITYSTLKYSSNKLTFNRPHTSKFDISFFEEDINSGLLDAPRGFLATNGINLIYKGESAEELNDYMQTYKKTYDIIGIDTKFI